MMMRTSLFTDKDRGHGFYGAVFGIVSLGLVLNALLVVACLPFVALLITTDPALSWPALALTAPLCGPALAAACAVLREHGQTVDGAAHGGLVRTFLAAYRVVFARGLAVATVVTAVVTVALVDVRMMSDTAASVLVVPLLLMVALLALGTGAVAIVAVAEAPGTRLLPLLRASLYLAVKRWPLTLLSLGAVAVQGVLFASLPALALGLTASATLYLVWADGRYTLTPALAAPPAEAI